MAIVKLETGEELEFDNNYSDEQISQAVEEYLGQKQPNQAQQPIQEPKQEGSMFGNIARGLPVGLGRAATGFVQAATDLGENAANRAERAIYGDEPMQKETFGTRLAGQIQQQNEQLAQEPMSTRFGVGVGEVLPYLATGAGTGRAVSSAIGGGAGRIAGLSAAGAVGGATQQGLSAQEQAGLDNRLGKAGEGAGYGALFGAGLGALGEGARAIGSAAKATGKQIYKGFKAPEVEQLEAIGNDIKQVSSNLYNQVRKSGATFKPDAVRIVLNDIDKSVKDGGTLFKTNHPKTISLLNEIKKDIAIKQKAGQSISLPELDEYRKAISSAIQDSVGMTGKVNDDGRRLTKAVRAIDNFLDNSQPEKVLQSGNPESFNLYKQAKGEWQRYAKFDSIQNIIKRADNDPNRLKTLVKNFVDNPKKTSGFNKLELDALKKASENSNAEGLFKAVGKFGFDLGSGRNIGNTIVPGASILYGGAKGSSAAAVGTLSRQAQKLAARGKIEDVLDIIRGAKPQESNKILNSLPIKTRDVILMNLLSKSAAPTSEANANELNMSEEEIRQQMIQMNQLNKNSRLPLAYSEEELANNPSKIKQRFYR